MHLQIVMDNIALLLHFYQLLFFMYDKNIILIRKVLLLISKQREAGKRATKQTKENRETAS